MAKGKELSASTIEATLKGIAIDINGTYETARSELVLAQLHVGERLIQARALFKGDNEFGKWREANTPIKNSNTALNLMKLAEAHRKDEIPAAALENMTKTAILAFLGAPPEVKKKVEKDISDGKPVTAKKIKEAVREEPEDVPLERPKQSQGKWGFEQTVQNFLLLKLPERIDIMLSLTEEPQWHTLLKLDKSSQALLTAGFGFDSGYAPADDITNIVFAKTANNESLTNEQKEFFVQTVWPKCMSHWRTLAKSNLE